VVNPEGDENLQQVKTFKLAKFLNGEALNEAVKKQLNRVKL
jgi:hypothetical protein